MITGRGLYRTRNGSKVEIVGERNGDFKWFGVLYDRPGRKACNLNSAFSSWKSDGSFTVNPKHWHDIIGRWEDFQVQCGRHYQTADGSIIQIQAKHPTNETYFLGEVLQCSCSISGRKWSDKAIYEWMKDGMSLTSADLNIAKEMPVFIQFPDGTTFGIPADGTTVKPPEKIQEKTTLSIYPGRYLMRRGDIAIIKSIDLERSQPVVGSTYMGNQIYAEKTSWFTDGRFLLNESACDLMYRIEPKAGEIWKTVGGNSVKVLRKGGNGMLLVVRIDDEPNNCAQWWVDSSGATLGYTVCNEDLAGRVKEAPELKTEPEKKGVRLILKKQGTNFVPTLEDIQTGAKIEPDTKSITLQMSADSLPMVTMGFYVQDIRKED